MIKSNFKNFIILSKYLKPYWKKQTLVLFLSFAIAVLSLANPYLAKLVIDQAYAQRDFMLFLKLLILGALVFIAISLFDGLSQYLGNYINIKVKFDLHKEIFEKLQRLPYILFQTRTTGEYIYKLIDGTEQVVSFITSLIPELFFAVPKFLFTFVILVTLNWKLTALLIMLVPFLYLPHYLLIHKITDKSKRLWDGSQSTLEIVREILSNMQLVKVFGKERAEVNRYIKQLITNIRINTESTKLNIIISFLDTWFNKLLFGLITLWGGYNIIKGNMSLGTFTAITIYVNQLIGLQSFLNGLFIRMIVENIPLQRLADILESWPEESEDKDARKFLFSQGAIEFKDVSFGYYPDKEVIKHLNFKIEGASIIGLVGLSGCGKTTLIHLIAKLYSLSAGEIFIDAQDINLIARKSLCQQIGVALQKPILWNDTIRNNIVYSRPDANTEEILRASEISCAYDFIKNLPQGFDTTVGEAGVRLSEGQKQRIALARAIIKNPKILIIDEGMSSLDSHTEDRIINNLKQNLKNTTIIVVSHRLSTIKKTDLVYFLESADKISIGYHEKLVKENVGYKELFASQIEEEMIGIKAE